MKFLKYIILILVGLALASLLHFLVQPNWNKDASIDVIFSILLDFFIVQIVIMAYEDRQETKFKGHLQTHLNKIERMIREHEPPKN